MSRLNWNCDINTKVSHARLISGFFVTSTFVVFVTFELKTLMMEQSDKNWSAGFFQNLSSLSSDRANADVTIWIGHRPISAHKFVLDTNSSIMRMEDVYFKRMERKYHVAMPTEFDEKFELVSNLITSFYTGVIEIQDDDVDFVHKFGNLFDIKWLKIKTLAIYDHKLSKKTFIQIFQFSHSICCEDLKGLCLDFLSEDVFDFLLDTGELLKINYFSVMSICKTKFAFVPDMKKFRFVCKWFETDVRSKICHLESIIPLLGYNTLVNSEVTLVFNWILENKHIDEDRRMNLMKKVNMRMNAPIDKATINFKEHKKLKACERNLQKIKESLLENKHLPDKFSISFAEFCSVVEYHFKDGDSLTKHLLTEFFTKNFRIFITEKYINDIIRLSTWDFPIFPIVDSLRKDDSVNILEIVSTTKWKHMSLKNIQSFVRETENIFEDSTKILYRIRVVESVMIWALHHPKSQEQVLELIKDAFCLCYFPAKYLESVLKPHILALSSGKEVRYQCSQHKWQTVLGKESSIFAVNVNPCAVKVWDENSNTFMKTDREYYCVGKLPKEVHMIKECTFNLDCKFYHTVKHCLIFQPENEEALFRIKTGRSIISNEPMLILYAEDQCMDSYPIFSTWKMHINKFREFVAKHKNLNVMAIGLFPL